MKITLVILTYLASLVIVAVVAFFVVMIIAGPHSGLLPQWAEAVMLALGWLTILVVPFVIARVVWRRLSRTQGPS